MGLVRIRALIIPLNTDSWRFMGESAAPAPEDDAPAPEDGLAPDVALAPEAGAPAPAGTEPAAMPESPPSMLESQASRSRVDAPREHEALEMKRMMKTLKVGEQAQFEYALMDEIVKLQEALEVNAVHTTKERAELQDKVDKVIAARSTSNAAAERMAEMEAAMQSAQQGELARIEQRRKESEDRMAAREKDAERVRKIEARKKEEQRLLAGRWATLPARLACLAHPATPAPPALAPSRAGPSSLATHRPRAFPPTARPPSPSRLGSRRCTHTAFCMYVHRTHSACAPHARRMRGVACAPHARRVHTHARHVHAAGANAPRDYDEGRGGGAA